MLLKEKQQKILDSVEDVIRAAQLLKTPEVLKFIETSSLMIANCFKSEGKILVAGNGGSLCDAMHFAEELTGLYRNKRPALPAIALSDPGHMSCVGNDLGYDHVFSRAVEALGKKGDVLVLLTTSGNSPNLIKAAEMAREKGLAVIAFLGKTGGKLKGMADLEWIVSGFSYSDRVQEVQMAAIHMIIEMVEEELFHAS
ncbi:MAG: SIS domain-containing protein [Rhabdochlamydiaceae bacterium]|nr:SIS domain-containing protein [Rhabdochlamydiaceae bacterium]